MVVIMYCRVMCLFCFFFFKQKTAYEMRISDWSSDVCSSDLDARARRITPAMLIAAVQALASIPTSDDTLLPSPFDPRLDPALSPAVAEAARLDPGEADGRSEEHTSELQSLMRTSYAVYCLKKKSRQTDATPKLPTLDHISINLDNKHNI